MATKFQHQKKKIVNKQYQTPVNSITTTTTTTFSSTTLLQLLARATTDEGPRCQSRCSFTSPLHRYVFSSERQRRRHYCGHNNIIEGNQRNVPGNPPLTNTTNHHKPLPCRSDNKSRSFS
ncbi:hypothetical protein HKD37_14G039415 [Glycine soja]